MSEHVLTVNAVDMQMLTEALSEGDPHHTWYFDPSNGDVRIGGDWSDGFDDDDLEHQGWVVIQPLSGRASFEDMELFAHAVGDVRARDLLVRSLEGKGVFRRFRDTMRDLPELKDSWLKWLTAREDARAIRWLLAGGYVDELDAEDALARGRGQVAGALDTVRGLGGLSVDIAEAPTRWAEIVGALEAGGAVALTRDGRSFAAITVYESGV